MRKNRVLGLLMAAVVTMSSIPMPNVGAEEVITAEEITEETDFLEEKDETVESDNEEVKETEEQEKEDVEEQIILDADEYSKYAEDAGTLAVDSDSATAVDNAISQGKYNGYVTNIVEYNKFYSVKDLTVEDSHPGSFYYYLDTNLPKNGRIKILITDCQTKNIDNEFRVYNSMRSASFYYNQKLTEDMDSGWVTSIEGRLVVEVSGSFNEEAKIKVLYESSDTYRGETELNDTLDTANFIEHDVVYESTFNKYLDKDYYRFTMEKAGSADIIVTKAYTLYTEDIHGNVTEMTSNTHLRLPAGNYIILVQNKDVVISKQEYTVCVKVNYESPEDYEQENNNVKSQANEIKFNHWYTGNLNTSKDIDSFKIQVTEPSTLALEFKILRQKQEKGWMIRLYDENLSQVLVQAYTTENPYLKTADVLCPAGVYYVRIEDGKNNYDDCSDYSFNVNQRAYTYITKIDLPESMTMFRGKTASLEYNVLPEDADRGYLSWSSSNTNVATVDENGKICANAVGTTQIILTATDRNIVAASCYLTVRNMIHVTEVTVPDTKTMTIGDVSSLKTTILPENADNKKLHWSSSDSSIASVDENGKITAKKAGVAYITVRADDDYNAGYWWSKSLYDECKVTVKKPVQYVTKVTFSKQNVTLEEDDYYELQPTVLPKDADNKALSWSSSNWKVADVDSDGFVYGRSCGTAKITAKAKDQNKISASYTITVYRKVNYVLNGGTNHSQNPTRYTGKSIALKNPTRKGYVFKGWYTDSKYKYKTTSINANTVKLYAKWEKVSVGKAAISSVKNQAGKKMLVKYKGVSKAEGYQIQYAADKKFKKNCISIDTKSKTYTVSNLEKGKTYYVRVRAYRKDSAGKVVYGKYSSVKKVKIKK